MSYAHAMLPVVRATPPMAALRTPKKMNLQRSRTGGAYVITFSSITVDGAALLTTPEEEATALIVDALQTAYEMEKPEFLIENIAPGVEINGESKTEVVDMQERLEGLLAEASLQLSREKPVSRLNLRGQEFDIRCYLGTERPTDFVSSEEWTQ